MGKRLTLIRHAKSSWDDPSVADFDRVLNSRGIRDADEVAGRLAGEGFAPGLIVSSPAGRALQTARAIAAALEIPSDLIREAPDIYEAPPQRILAVVRALPDEIDHAVLFGHNPGFHSLANQLLYRDDVEDFPTCGVCEMELLVDRWADAGHELAELVRFRTPKAW